jgi:predicted N-acetyltransferase YhbS
MSLIPESPAHAEAIERLLDAAFGANRQQKTSYRLREGVAPVPGLSWVVVDDHSNDLLATIRYWPVQIGGIHPALLLGPIAVDASRRGEGWGGLLMHTTLERARLAGHSRVLLVGDAPYYGRFGFTRAVTTALTLPGPVELSRFLGLELVPGAFTGVRGAVEKVGAGDFATHLSPAACAASCNPQTLAS